MFLGPRAHSAQRLQSYVNRSPGHRSKQFLVSLFFLSFFFLRVCRSHSGIYENKWRTGEGESELPAWGDGEIAVTGCICFVFVLLGEADQLELGRQDLGHGGGGGRRKCVLTFSSLNLTE